MAHLRTLSLLAAGLVAAACGGTEPELVESVASVSVSPAQVSVDVGGTAQLSATVRNQVGDVLARAVDWSVQPQGVVTVNNSGLVTAQAVGTATVTASAGGRNGSAQVTVVDPSPPAAPSGVQAAALSNTTAQVSWNDDSTNESEFVVEREATGAGSAAGPARVYAEAGRVGANTTSFQDAGLAPATGYRYRVRACNTHGCSGPVGGTGAAQMTTYATLVIQTTSLPVAAVGAGYSQQLAASGGTGAVVWSVAAGTLPPGLSLSQDGEIGGTPTTEGSWAFTVQAEGAGQSPTRALSITVSASLAISTAELPTGITGQAYSVQLQAVGGSGGYQWNILLPGGLPSGFALGFTTGIISGTPSSPSNSTFTVQVSSGGLTATRQFTIRVFNPVFINNTSLAVGKVGQSYSQPVTAGGGDGTFTWALVGGQLPPGISLSTQNNTGVLSGTPTTAGSWGVTLQATSGDGQTVSRSFTFTVNP